MIPVANTRTIFLEKLLEQTRILARLIQLVPADKLDWCPDIPRSGADCSARQALSFGELLGHLLECLAGFCATLYAAHPDKLAHLIRLRELPVNHRCEVNEAGDRLREYVAHIQEGFSVLEESDLVRLLPTVFVPEGEAVLTLLLGNLEHVINHKYQLFIYLKLIGIKLSTSDLYVFR